MSLFSKIADGRHPSAAVGRDGTGVPTRPVATPRESGRKCGDTARPDSRLLAVAVPPAAATKGPAADGTSAAGPAPHGVAYRYCVPCNARERMHLNGECVVCATQRARGWR